jgi:hypothetical protein
MVILLLTEVRRVSVAEAQKVVAAECGQESAATVRAIDDAKHEHGPGMEYLDWQVDSIPFHIGTSSEPYISLVGVSKAGQPVKWTMKEEVPPDDEHHRAAWMSHNAWLYVDALTIGSPGGARAHLGAVLRVASHFIDERCVLVWLYGRERWTKRLATPTKETKSALSRGKWPSTPPPG